MKKNTFIGLLLLCLTAIGSNAQNFTFDTVLNPNIKTVLLHKLGAPLSDPVIELKSAQKLLLSFDDISSREVNYKYTIIHCDANWKITDAVPSEYLNGFHEDYIEDYNYSLNTIQSYIHYQLEFPNYNISPILSGNYILKVFNEDDQKTLLIRRFKIVEQKINVNGKAQQAINVSKHKFQQELVFDISSTGLRIHDPYSNLKVFIQQNGRKDNMMEYVKPSLVKGNIIQYRHHDKLTINGINEYRFFDFRSLKYIIEPTYRISYDTNVNHVFLKPDQRRPYQVYLEQEDINGKRLIKTYDGDESNVESDYAWVYFVLAYDAPISYGDIHLMGDLTNWKLDENSKMHYNFEAKAYIKRLYLKQGYYNYHYAFVENKRTIADVSFVEGTHSVTENEYKIWVYYKEPGTRFDQLIGFHTLKAN